MARRRIARKEAPQALSPEEVDRLIARAEAQDPPMALLIRLLFESGARVSEALSVRPVDIELVENARAAWVSLPNLKRRLRAGQKAPTKRCVITAELARDLLKAARGGPDDPIFASPKDPKLPLSRQAVWRRLTKLCEAEGVRRIGKDGRLRPAWVHTLRHGAAVRLVLAGVPAPLVQEQLGHASLATTQQYFDLAEQAKLELLGRALRDPGLKP
mgnify:FL=1